MTFSYPSVRAMVNTEKNRVPLCITHVSTHELMPAKATSRDETSSPVADLSRTCHDEPRASPQRQELHAEGLLVTWLAVLQDVQARLET